MSVNLISAGSGWGTFIWGQDFWQDAIYELDPGLTLQSNPVDSKIDTRNILFNDGTISAGNEIQGRKIIVAGTVISDNRTAHRALMDLTRFECSRQGLKLSQDSETCYVNLAALVSLTEDAITGYDRAVSTVRITWQADDPFWYASASQSVTTSVTGTQTFPVDGLAGGQMCTRGNSPVITVTAPPGGSVSGFTLANLSDGGLIMSYSDTSLVNGASVVIDCYNGTINRVSGLTTTPSARFFDGEFLRLLTQINQIQYVGPPATVNFTWQPRWL